MNKATPAQVEIVRALLGRAVADGTSQERAAAAGRIFSRIHRHLSPLIGSAGVRALFTRAAGLLLSEHPCLTGLSLPATPAAADTDPADLLRDCLKDQAPAAITESMVAFFAIFFALLASFIGDRLCAQAMETAAHGAAEPIPSERKL